MFFNREHTRTPFIQLNTKKCKACWKCMAGCSNQVIGKVDLPWHKHALIVEPDSCTGCLNCIDICNFDAYSVPGEAKQETGRHRKHTFIILLINNLLLVSGLVMVISGLVLQLGFHLGGPQGHQIDVHEVQSRSIQYEQVRELDTNKIVCGFNYPFWTKIHKFAIVIFSLLMVYHTQTHWKWYKGVVRKHLIGKNLQVFVLSVLFLLVAITGLVPWFIDLSGGIIALRMIFIEIHDKLALIFTIYLILHLIKRNKWFIVNHN